MPAKLSKSHKIWLSPKKVGTDSPETVSYHLKYRGLSVFYLQAPFFCLLRHGGGTKGHWGGGEMHCSELPLQFLSICILHRQASVISFLYYIHKTLLRYKFHLQSNENPSKSLVIFNSVERPIF
jgi:hypothetical protein